MIVLRALRQEVQLPSVAAGATGLDRALTAVLLGECGYDQEAFTIDWDQRQVACPGDRTSRTWSNRLSQQGLTDIWIQFSVNDSRPCPVRTQCINSPTDPCRELRLRQHDEHQALRAARTDQADRCLEGALQDPRWDRGDHRARHPPLRPAQIPLPRPCEDQLQHQLTGAAINLARIDSHLTENPRARTRTSRFAALRPADQPVDGANKGPNYQQRPVSGSGPPQTCLRG